jgi:hypothetical protein
LIPSSKLLASKPRDCTLKREQNSCYEHDNGLKSYGKQRGHDSNSAFSYVIFYYGKCSIPKPFSITGAELDQHFSWPINDSVEEVNRYFQGRLFAILAGAH